MCTVRDHSFEKVFYFPISSRMFLKPELEGISLQAYPSKMLSKHLQRCGYFAHHFAGGGVSWLSERPGTEEACEQHHHGERDS